MTDLHHKLRKQLDEAAWELLKPHALRDKLIIVRQDLDLLEAAFRIANDEKEIVEDWIRKGLVGKPTPDQLKLWESQPKRKFLTLIVNPYVLAQEMLLH